MRGIPSRVNSQPSYIEYALAIIQLKRFWARRNNASQNFQHSGLNQPNHHHQTVNHRIPRTTIRSVVDFACSVDGCFILKQRGTGLFQVEIQIGASVLFS